VALVAGRLEAQGVVSPAIAGVLDAYPLAHGVSTRDRALKDCSACHSDDSRVADAWPIAGYLPGGVPPAPPEKPRVGLAGTVGPTPSGGLALQRRVVAPAGLHLLGFSRQGTSNTIGFLLFVAVVVGVALHALGRLLLGRWRSGEAPARHGGKKVYAFSLYERIWHWTMALSGAALILTGLEIHRAGSPWLLSLPAAVAGHNVFAAVLMANAFLSLFYHLTTRAIVNFIPEPKGFLRRTLEHVSWQSRGIFFGGAHPAHVEGEKLNPLQQVTYLGLLNVLFPLQIGTGLAIWAVGAWPEVASAIGGLAVVAPLHNLGAWLFLAFFVMHVYLTTTGRTVGDHLRSMVTGYQEVDGGAHADPAP
jgi:thiosulfate reductase cytochrome b subunit